jgi:hypothetical protein
MHADLSLRHEPITDLFAWPKSPEEWDRFRLSAGQVDFFRREGYLAPVQVLDERQLEALRTELVELMQPNHSGRELWYEYHSNESSDPTQVLFHALGAWRLRAALHDVLWNPRFLMPASQLLDGAVRFWHDQLFCKPARHGGVVAWHQDYSYWTRTKPMAHLTCWIGLDESTRENGCLQYIAGSHLWDLLPITGLAGDMEAIRGVLTTDQWQRFQNPAATALKAGECAFHHPLLVHGSYQNRTEHPRRAIVLNAIRDGVCSASNEPLLAGTPAIPAGKPIGGQFFPLLFSP